MENNSNKYICENLYDFRSGEEGVFPHLLKFCENKLRDADPCNQLLCVAEKANRYSEIPESERKEILKDMEVKFVLSKKYF